MGEGLRSREFLVGVAIFLAALVIFSVGIRSIGYSSPDEKRYKQSAGEMVESGDWVTPTYHGRPRFQKPILFYWVTASSMTLFGNNWFGARLPSAVFGAMTVFLTYLLGRGLYNRRTGVSSASLLAISALFFIYSRLSTPDIMMLFFITLSIYIFVKLYFQDGPRLLSPLFFSAIALATLTKGLVGLAIPLITITLFLFIFRKDPPCRKINLPLGVIIFFCIVLPWFIIMYKTHGNIYVEHIWRIETINRARDLWTGGGNTFLKLSKSFLRYIVMTFIAFLPATIFLPASVISMIKQRSRKPRDALILFWVCTAIVFFTLIGTKKIHYLLSLAPPLCLIMGRYLAEIGERKGRAPAFFAPFVLSALAVFIFIFACLLPNLNKEDGLLLLSEKILSLRKEGEPVGVGSHFISHNRVDSYMGINVKKVNVDLSDPREQIGVSRRLLTEFFNRRERVFCLITSRDYQDYIPDGLKGRIFVIDKGWYWKKPNQLKLNAILSTVLRTEKNAFTRSLKNEILLISNRP